MYEIKLFGPGQAYFDGKIITGFPGQQHCLLFYYFLLNRHVPYTREQVATVFWGDDSSSVALKNLRNALWRLRQAFRSVGASVDDLISIQEDCIAFLDTDSYQLDIDRFEAAARLCLHESRSELSDDEVTLLENAVELYSGDLLEGIYEDWCLYERERLRLAFLNILIRLMDHHSRKGNYEHGLGYGKRILLLDPTRERVHRQIMLIHWLAGNRESALLQYRSCCNILQTELGLKPAQETQHLYETILHSSSVSAKGNLEDSASLRSSTNIQSNQPLREMMQKLHFLEMIVEQTNAELHRLEGMIRQVLDVE
jgi:DNA-binding SARP family transcriptional activator